METQILTTQNILFALTFIGVIFSIYRSYKEPQISIEKDSLKLTDRVLNLEKGIVEIREKHLEAITSDLKELNTTLQDLSHTVIKLSTVIDERIPRDKK